ncbi:phasin family protein [Methylocystis suflitae]|uniref:phasin family protein n=1 Tax=Methylocystis suflitae TaxID=2951405 RepID=UPI00210C16BB|nr:phasin family protein [Methylocystis suflitae]MCQ4189332.1 phasin family protein [Methylocystis suflitae]
MSKAVSDEPSPAAVEAQTPVFAAAPSTALAISEPPKPAESEADGFDPALWQKKSIDLWAENATAFLDFAERLANAKTIDEVTTLQSRFVSDRLDALLRQSTELMTLAQRLLNFSIAPIYGARAA